MHSQAVEAQFLANVWGVGVPTTRGPRPRLTLDELADAGVAVADATDLERLSLAAVATRLGVATTALYRYVGSRDELVELVVDRAVGPPPSLPGSDWDAGAAAWALALLDRYREHHWLASVQPAGQPRFPNRIGWIEALLEVLRDSPATEPMYVALLLDSLARTFAGMGGSAGQTESVPPWMHDAVSRRYPLFARELARDWTDVDEAFSSAVTTVLHGASRLG